MAKTSGRSRRSLVSAICLSFCFCAQQFHSAVLDAIRLRRVAATELAGPQYSIVIIELPHHSSRASALVAR